MIGAVLHTDGPESLGLQLGGAGKPSEGEKCRECMELKGV